MTGESERTGAGVQAVRRVDVVLDKQRDSVQRAEQDAARPQSVGGFGLCENVWIAFEHRVEPLGPASIRSILSR